MLLQLSQGGLAQQMSASAAQGGQARAQGGEVRCMHHNSKYIYYCIDKQSLSDFTVEVKTLTRFPARYRQLQRQLTHLGYLSQGSVFERRPGQQGSRFVWTRKVKAKTVTVALSQEQYIGCARR